jgi:hypothetical protein
VVEVPVPPEDPLVVEVPVLPEEPMVVEVPVLPEDPLVEVPLPEDPLVVEVPVPPEDPLVVEVPLLPEDPLVEVPLPEEPVVVVLLPEDPLVEVPPLEPLWAGVKGMFPPPQPTRETTANTKMHILSMRCPFRSGIGTDVRIPFGQMGLRGPRTSNIGLLD